MFALLRPDYRKKITHVELIRRNSVQQLPYTAIGSGKNSELCEDIACWEKGSLVKQNGSGYIDTSDVCDCINRLGLGLQPLMNVGV